MGAIRYFETSMNYRIIPLYNVEDSHAFRGPTHFLEIRRNKICKLFLIVIWYVFSIVSEKPIASIFKVGGIYCILNEI
jgi:hypothetical protein